MKYQQLSLLKIVKSTRNGYLMLGIDIADYQETLRK